MEGLTESGEKAAGAWHGVVCPATWQAAAAASRSGGAVRLVPTVEVTIIAGAGGTVRHERPHREWRESSRGVALKLPGGARFSPGH